MELRTLGFVPMGGRSACERVFDWVEWSVRRIESSVNGLDRNLGERIKELRDDLANYRGSTSASASVADVGDLQNRRGARQYRLSVLRRRRNEAVDNRMRVDTELRGYRKALSLFDGAHSGQEMGRSQRRLLLRVDTRMDEAVELSNDIAELESEICDVASELRVIEEGMVDELRTRVANAASRQAATAVTLRTKAVAAGDTISQETGPLWSPTPVLAYRIWGLKADGFYGAWTRWTESTKTASCMMGEGVPHTDGRCNGVAFGCGIYAAKDMNLLLRRNGVTLKKDFAAGLVALEGKVVEHERGYRAERTTVLSLIIVHYGVMTIVDNERHVQDAFVDPRGGGDETVILLDEPGDDYMTRTITSELKKREEGHSTWT